MSEQKLDRTWIPCSTVDQNGFRPAQRLSAKLGRVEPNAGHPLLDEPTVLTFRQSASVATTGEEELTRLALGHTRHLIDRLSRLVGQLEPDNPTGFLLPDSSAIHRLAARRNVIDKDGDDVTAAPFAADRWTEEGKIGNLRALQDQLGHSGWAARCVNAVTRLTTPSSAQHGLATEPSPASSGLDEQDAALPRFRPDTMSNPV